MRGFARAARVAGVYAERLYARIYGGDTLRRCRLSSILQEVLWTPVLGL